MNASNFSSTAAPEAPQPGWSRLLGSSLRAALFVALVTGVAYPLVTTWIAQALWPQQAAGSLLLRNGQLVGSAWLGQDFTASRYFHGRPSATTADDPAHPGQSKELPYNAALSSGSNQGPTNQALIAAVAARAAAYRQANGLAAGMPLPVDAVTASASGLDPHISVANARLQAARVAQARQLPLDQVQALLAAHTEPRLLGLLGEPRVNVLRLNLALDELAVANPAAAQ